MPKHSSASVAAPPLVRVFPACLFPRPPATPLHRLLRQHAVTGCVFPPDQVDFLAGQYFDIRLEVHAPVNGSEATGNPNPDTNFAFTVARPGQPAVNASTFFGVAEPALERWNFTWYEDLFAQAAGTPSLVNVAAKAYRRVALYEVCIFPRPPVVVLLAHASLCSLESMSLLSPTPTAPRPSHTGLSAISRSTLR